MNDYNNYIVVGAMVFLLIGAIGILHLYLQNKKLSGRLEELEVQCEVLLRKSGRGKVLRIEDMPPNISLLIEHALSTRDHKHSYMVLEDPSKVYWKSFRVFLVPQDKILSRHLLRHGDMISSVPNEKTGKTEYVSLAKLAA